MNPNKPTTPKPYNIKYHQHSTIEKVNFLKAIEAYKKIMDAYTLYQYKRLLLGPWLNTNKSNIRGEK